jgi:hypothetical protein
LNVSAGASTIFAIPKSVSFTNSPSGRGTSSTFSGLRSRWMTPSSCARPSADAACITMRAARGQSNAPRFSTSRSDSPSTYSMTRKTRPPSSPKSVISTMFGWLMRLTARASRKNRSRCAAFMPRSCRRILIALSRSIMTWRAR